MKPTAGNPVVEATGMVVTELLTAPLSVVAKEFLAMYRVESVAFAPG
jgi:hypothetical protein